ncbi:MAG: helix-turn-helix domain containing protein [Acetobacteraceae bacterium]|nr:helix-turn-helix domain containing protein [Acetobacteraceae bacterium]
MRVKSGAMTADDTMRDDNTTRDSGALAPGLQDQSAGGRQVHDRKAPDHKAPDHKAPGHKALDHKAQTRQRILEAAGVLFRQHGIDGVGVDAVMRAAGLTHGGFYGHFASKEALVAEVAAASLARAATRWERIAAQDGAAALAAIVGSYLDPGHVVALDRACVLTTLGPEVARRPEQLPAISDSVRRMTAVLRQGLPDADGTQALAALSTMVGAVVLARLADDPAAAEAVLAAAKAAVLG